MKVSKKFDLTLSGFKSFKPLAFAKTKKVGKKHELSFIQVAIPVPNSSFCIVSKPKIEVDKKSKKIQLTVVVDGKGNNEEAGQLLYFSFSDTIVLTKSNENDFDLEVIVNERGNTRPGKLGKSVIKTVDEDD